MTHVQPQISSAPCIFCRTRRVPFTLQDYLPIAVYLYFSDQLLGCPHPPRFEMFPHHAGDGPGKVQSGASCQALTNLDRDSTILLHRPHPIRYHTQKSSPKGHRLKFVYSAWIYYHIRVREVDPDCSSILKQCSQFPWRDFLPSLCSDMLRSAVCGVNDTPVKPERLRQRQLSDCRSS